jgi:hypothetical protein
MSAHCQGARRGTQRLRGPQQLLIVLVGSRCAAPPSRTFAGCVRLSRIPPARRRRRCRVPADGAPSCTSSAVEKRSRHAASTSPRVFSMRRFRLGHHCEPSSSSSSIVAIRRGFMPRRRWPNAVVRELQQEVPSVAMTAEDAADLGRCRCGIEPLRVVIMPQHDRQAASVGVALAYSVQDGQSDRGHRSPLAGRR